MFLLYRKRKKKFCFCHKLVNACPYNYGLYYEIPHRPVSCGTSLVLRKPGQSTNKSGVGRTLVRIDGVLFQLLESSALFCRGGLALALFFSFFSSFQEMYFWEKIRSCLLIGGALLPHTLKSSFSPPRGPGELAALIQAAMIGGSEGFRLVLT